MNGRLSFQRIRPITLCSISVQKTYQAIEQLLGEEGVPREAFYPMIRGRDYVGQ